MFQRNIKEVTLQRTKQEKLEKDLLQKKDDTIEEMMDLEDKFELIKEEEAEDAEEMQKQQELYREIMNKAKSQTKQLK